MSSPAVENALSYLRRGLDDGTWPPGSRLPTVSACAKAIPASRNTIIKALHALEEEGRVVSIRGSGTYVAPLGDGGTQVDVSLCKWQTVKNDIYEDIVRGAYGSRLNLENLQVLQERYGTSYATLKKALRALQSDGVLVSYKKGYRIRQTTAGFGTVGFVSIAPVDPGEGQIQIFHTFMGRTVSFFEQECARRQVQFVRIGFQTNAVGRVEQKLERLSGALGFFFWINSRGMKHEQHAEVFSVVLSCTRRKIRVVIFDESGDVAVPPALLCSPYVQVLTIAAADGGRAVGHYLQSLGHRRAAYFLFPKGAYWAKERHRGLRAAFSASPNAVRCIRQEREVEALPFGLAATNVDRAKLGWFLELAFGPRRKELFVRDTERVREEAATTAVHYPNQVKRMRYTVEECLRFLLGSRARGYPVRTHILEGYLKYLRNAGGTLVCHSLFAQAVADPSISAWVCPSEKVALLALDFLRERGIAVPGKISVIGFDNYSLSLERELTSFDFNPSEIVNRTLSFIFDARRSLTTRQREPFEVPGMIIERTTTGRAR